MDREKESLDGIKRRKKRGKKFRRSLAQTKVNGLTRRSLDKVASIENKDSEKATTIFIFQIFKSRS